MPQTDTESGESLLLYNIALTICFCLLVGNDSDSSSLDEYITAFLQYAYYTDEVCFLLDLTLQRFFGLVAYYVLLQNFFSITRLNGRAFCSVQVSSIKLNSLLTFKMTRYLVLSVQELKRYFNNSLVATHVNKNF